MNFFMSNRITNLGPLKNNLQLDINEKREELFKNYYFENNSERYDSLSNKKSLSLEKLSKTNLTLISKIK